MDYYSYYKFLLNYYDKNTSLIITQYVFAKCIDCNDSYHDEYYECKCNKLRCKQHTYFKTIIIDGKFNCNTCFNDIYGIIIKVKRIFIKCMYCDNEAVYGHCDLVCYCACHIIFKKYTIFTLCFYNNCINKVMVRGNHYNKCNEHNVLEKNIHYIENDNDNDEIAILDINGKKCSFCNMRYKNMYYKCECNIYCDYCFFICTWVEHSNFVCNDCCSINNIYSRETLRTYIRCHKDDCIEYATYGKYGILLYCDSHAKYDKLGYKCKIINCAKLVVYNNCCYDHISNKIRKKIDYIIKQ